MITVIQKPSTFSLSGNPIPVVLQTDNMYSSLGAKGQLTMIFTAIDTTAGRSFKLTWGTHEVTFTSAATPNQSGTQFKVCSGGDTYVTACSYVYQAFLQNYDLMRDFVITRPVINTIQLVSRDYGVSITLSNSTHTGYVYQMWAGSNRVMREGFKVFLQVYDQNDNLIGEDRVTPGEDLTASFDISGWLQDTLEVAFIEEPLGLLTQVTDAVAEYKLRYGEAYSGTQQQATLMDDTFYYLDGGTPQDDFFVLLQQNHFFLTSQPNPKKISKEQPERLYFLCYDTAINFITLKVKQYFDDASSTVYTKGSAQEVSVGQMWMVEADYSALITEVSGKRVLYYDVWLADNFNGYASEVRRYYVDHIPRRTENILVYRNSLGTFSTERMLGYSESIALLDNLSVDVTQEVGLRGTRKRADVVLSDQIVMNTGVRGLDEMQRLDDLLLSKEIYLWDGDYHAVIITSTQVKRAKNDTTAYYADIILEHATRRRHHFQRGTSSITLPSGVLFSTYGSTLDAEVESSGGTITWEYSDATTSSLVEPPVKDFGSAAIRGHMLKTTDWSKITRIIFGDRTNGTGLQSASGFELATKLTRLYVAESNLTLLNLSENQDLEYLYAWDTKLTELDLRNNTKVISVDASNSLLTRVRLKSQAYTALQTLKLGYNAIRDLDCRYLTAIVILEINNNLLTSLDLSNSTLLTTLDASDNMISSLSLKSPFSYSNISSLKLNNNLFTSFAPESNDTLTVVELSDNPLSYLDVSALVEITTLKAARCALSAVYLGSCTTMDTIDLQDNQLTSINVSPFLALQYCDLSNNDLSAAQVKKVLEDVNNFGTNNGYLDLRGNAVPAEGYETAVGGLTERGWDVYIEEEGE